MKCFRIRESKVKEGIRVNTFHSSDYNPVTGGGYTYDYISVGETGRGRSEFRIPVRGGDIYNWTNEEIIPGTNPERLLQNGSVGKNSKGNYIITAPVSTFDDRVLCALTFDIGFRGENYYEYNDKVLILGTGSIAQGDAGRMGSGTQHICIFSPGAEITVTKSGRLYGDPASFVVKYDGNEVTCMSVEESQQRDILSTDSLELV